MADAPQTSSPGPQRKHALILGLGIGIGMVVGKTVDAVLLPALGYWGAFGCSLLAAAAAAGLVALLVLRLVR